MDLSGLSSDIDLGFELVGGREDPHYPNDSGIYVASIIKGSVADGKLRYTARDCVTFCSPWRFRGQCRVYFSFFSP